MFGGEKPLLTAEQLGAIIETAKARNVWCCAHVLEADLIPMLLDADIPEFCHMPTDRVPDELLREMAERGVTVVPTLCTINAAKVCKIDDQVGSIEVGKRANIIAVKDAIDGAFEALSHVEFVMNRGQVIKGA